MIAGIVLRKGRFSKLLRKRMEQSCEAAGVSLRYVEMKWGRWQTGPATVVYSVVKNGARMGWIVYDRERSTIEETLPVRPRADHAVEGEMVDALVAKESLVAAAIPKEDREKYRSLVAYGFRPTGHFEEGGFQLVRMELSIAVLLNKTRGMKAPKDYRKRERVAIERVPKTRDEAEIKTALENLIGKLGGLKRYVKPGQTVLIKPNIVSDHGLKEGVLRGGIVTDVRVVKALVEILLPVAGKIIIGEGSSINRSETVKQFHHYGYDRIVALDPEKVGLVDLNTDRQVAKPVPGGKRMLARKVPLSVEQADVVISLPVLKIHFAAKASLSIKNLQGALPPLEKYMSHFFGLWQTLVNIHHLIKPKLIIIDGLVGQEDFGPISGTPKEMNLLIGGTNPVAVDAVAMRVMGLDPVTSPPVFLGYMQGLGPLEQEKIEIVGPSVEEVMSPFKQPEINLNGGAFIKVHGDEACSGCRGYLHFVLNKLRRPDPQDKGRLLIDRPFERMVNIFLGPAGGAEANSGETNIFMGVCQQHNKDLGVHLPGCPPHAEVITDGILGLFPDVERSGYADKSEEARLGEMLQQILDTL
jgi:uncharacterized protein (DUF362 family)